MQLVWNAMNINFSIRDGNDVGFLELYPDAAKKQLYIGMIGGKAGLYFQ